MNKLTIVRVHEADLFIKDVKFIANVNGLKPVALEYLAGESLPGYASMKGAMILDGSVADLAGIEVGMIIVGSVVPDHIHPMTSFIKMGELTEKEAAIAKENQEMANELLDVEDHSEIIRHHVSDTDYNVIPGIAPSDDNQVVTLLDGEVEITITAKRIKPVFGSIFAGHFDEDKHKAINNDHMI
jgi:hypothetical protein